VQAGDRLLDLPVPALPGGHQIDNAGVAVLAAREVGLPEAAIAAGGQRAGGGGRRRAVPGRGAQPARRGGAGPHAG
ncbi:MAG: bifunctional folylpolyglutamate synthase/dihydrofolate synthase, partial [Brevundimonas sp.]